jgi:hypothetical protein
MWPTPSMLVVGGRDEIKWYRKRFETSGLAVFVWRAYFACRMQERAIPKWILKYLDDVAAGFYRLTPLNAAVPDGDAEALIATTLKMRVHGKKPGQGTAFSKYSAFLKSKRLADDLAVELYKTPRGKFYIAVDAVAKKHNVSRSTVERAWANWIPKTETAFFKRSRTKRKKTPLP